MRYTIILLKLLKPMIKVAIALFSLSLSACLLPSSSDPSANTSSQSPSSSSESIAVTPSTESVQEPDDVSTQQPSSPPQSSGLKEAEVPESYTSAPNALPTLPTTPIASLPSSDVFDVDSTIPTLSVPKSDTTSLQQTKDILAKGTFISGKNLTQGGIIIVDDEGTPVIELTQDFQTEDGPDLVLLLHRVADPLADVQPPDYQLKEGDYVEIAPLKASYGQQYYSVPAAIILDNYNSVVIWCRTFNTTFGAASLQ
ncbi:MAG: DM13 domain-containing protein [Cyanobacteria bacterium P01_F01_bin.150]